MILTLAGRTPRIAASAYIAPSADIIGSVELARTPACGSNACCGETLNPSAVGANSNIQDGTIIHTMTGAPAVVGEWVTVGHRVVLHGCTVENHCLIGMGAVLLNHVHVGEGSIVAAGALVAENTVIPPRSLYMGVPAKLRREVTEDERAFIKRHGTNYLQYKESYMAESRPQREKL